LAARRVVLLDAPADVLALRCAGKFASDADPDFLDDLRSRFRMVYADLPHVIHVDASAPLDEVIAVVARINAQSP
jgi:thymidylate kinase